MANYNFAIAIHTVIVATIMNLASFHNNFNHSHHHYTIPIHSSFVENRTINLMRVNLCSYLNHSNILHLKDHIIDHLIIHCVISPYDQIN